MSLSDLLGRPYTSSVCAAQAFLTGVDPQSLQSVADQAVDFYPEAFQQRLDELVGSIGEQVCAGLSTSANGAGTVSFNKALTREAAPLAGLGFTRVGEGGRLHLIAKSEHYHASLGHSFPGYQLVDLAAKLGIPNATHNNTRGHITRLLEQELVRVANGIPREDPQALARVLESSDPGVLNRVINLETGSLAVEAALKMVLARFYRLEETFPAPKYAGKIPVILVVADHAGGKLANYHGTTILTQVMRGMWPDLSAHLEAHNLLLVRPVRINDLADFEKTLAVYDDGPYKVAAFFHEIVLMNYGGILLEKEYLQRAYDLCRAHDVPTMVDEIQSCIWSPEFFLFREYGLRPDFVSIGKGFPGGQYPASKILTTPAMDTLNQFGALVTNGQEELASLTMLITMAFVEANRQNIAATGDYYAEELKRLAGRYPRLIQRIEGLRHLSTIFFDDPQQALAFIHALNQAGIDISAQTYKAQCPPAALTKIPLISSRKMVDFLIGKMDQALSGLLPA